MINRALKVLNNNKSIIVIIIGCILRLMFIGKIPGNYNYFQDEAFSAYEAYSIVNYGIDSHGYHNPVYLETWGSGMSAVQCYIQSLFVRILGFGPVAIRLPQALLGCLTLIFFYLLVKEVAEERVAFWSTFVLAIAPWHIIMSRWGLDCNYYVGFVTIALYLLVTSRNVLWKTIVAAIVMGITLYSYASPWVVMPFLVYGIILVLYIKKEMNLKSIIIYTMTLGIVVIPLFLFIMVNLDFIGEIRTSYISIPRLSYFRSDDAKPSIANLKQLVTYFWTQYDYISYDSALPYGTYYLFSNVFLVIGLIKDLIKRSKKSFVMWFWFICALILGILVQANFERINMLFLPLFYFIGTGIVFVIDLFKNTKAVDSVVIGALYCISGVLFAKYYFTDYNAMMERVWPEGVEEAIVFANTYDGTIHVQDIRHPFVLCYSKYPTDKYVETVVYEDENAKFLQPVSFEGYDFGDFVSQSPVKNDIYICSVNNEEVVTWLTDNDMAVAQFGNYYVGVAN
ncbi:glycosyltransferase family 39 protein [Pseudobutyrivibrio sp. MD2005]|uniref:glycosyltransferase family 39 protein n=1 Tax=Pseudobutyrivibrio sp. MD2005 TaxID=1410616 RepID=UPI0004856BC5|nr:glycosyltransferase family 39 protein [Pseudobutyrivibrio sp. MD2005]